MNTSIINKCLIVSAIAVSGLIFTSGATAQESRDGLNGIIANLASSKTKDQALKDAVAFAETNGRNRDRIVERLSEGIKSGDDLVQRGWAIAAIAEIGGQDVDEFLLNIHADEKQEAVVRSWAAAARVSMTKTTAGLIEKANLVQQFPSLGRPIGLRIIEQMSSDDEVSVEDVISATTKVPQLAQALTPAILAFDVKDLVHTMSTSADQNVRRIATSYVATKAQQGEEGIAEPIVAMVKFDVDAEKVPWDGGPLFIPQLDWGKEDARALVGNLIRWLVWCDQKNDTANIQVIHNNIRSLQLAGAAGYESPGWNDAQIDQWLIAWGKAVGADEIKAILNEQDIATRKYKAVFDVLD